MGLATAREGLGFLPLFLCSYTRITHASAFKYYAYLLSLSSLSLSCFCSVVVLDVALSLSLARVSPTDQHTKT